MSQNTTPRKEETPKEGHSDNTPTKEEP